MTPRRWPTSWRNMPGPKPRSRPTRRARARRTSKRSRRPTLDLKLIRRDPEGVKAALARRGAEASVDELLALDQERRRLLPLVEERRAEQNRVSEEIAE